MPAHDIPIWLGAYKPRILNLAGRVADGWLPSLGYLPDGLASLEEMNKHIDEGAASAGRDLSKVRRLLNISGQFTRSGRSLLNGPPQNGPNAPAGKGGQEDAYGVVVFLLVEERLEMFEP